MKKIRIDYYTGTGGSKLIAELLAEKLKINNIQIEINRIFRKEIEKNDEFQADYYMLIFPVHSFCAPLPVYEWIAHLEGNVCTTAVISISGGGDIISNSAARVKTVKLLKQSNFNVVFEEMIRMPNNWMKAPEEKKYTRILTELPPKIEEIAQAVLLEKKQKKSIYWIDYLISALGEAEKKGTKKFGNGIKISEICNACGLCAKNCCSSNIQIEDGKPVFGNACDMCLGCIYNCPQKALAATKMAFQVDKNGYDLRAMCEKAGAKL